MSTAFLQCANFEEGNPTITVADEEGGGDLTLTGDLYFDPGEDNSTPSGNTWRTGAPLFIDVYTDDGTYPLPTVTETGSGETVYTSGAIIIGFGAGWVDEGSPPDLFASVEWSFAGALATMEWYEPEAT